MKKNAGGFTLIELVAVMAILAILAVIAIPQFADLRVDAANASAAGVGGAIASGSAINYAKGVATPGNAGVKEVAGCDENLVDILVGATSGAANKITVSGRTYTIGGAAGPIATSATAACTIKDDAIAASTAQTFTIVGCASGGGCAP